jgi:predicted alpha/beta-fold hydrolase
VIPSVWPCAEPDGRVEHRVVQVADDTAIRLDINRPDTPARGTLLLVHGMCGSSESGYMRRTARSAVDRAWVAVRMNLRNCGGTEPLSRTLYNAGQSDDVARALSALEEERFPRPFVAAGFSLGGNIVLRYAGLEGAASRADAIAAVNPPIDLERCACAMELRRNRAYQSHYTRGLARQLRRIHRARGTSLPRPPKRRIRTVRQFDELYTAPDAGHPSAEAYYATASAGPHLGRIRRPGLILSSANDPIVPLDLFTSHYGNTALRFEHPARGGHCGYWQSAAPRFWAGERVLDFFEATSAEAR